MRLTHFFIDRPIFATVLSVFVTLVGLGALTILPVAQYPEIVPPTVQITTVYPGASAETVARTVATPSRTGGCQLRVSSPAGLSTLTTSAPRSASSMVA